MRKQCFALVNLNYGMAGWFWLNTIVDCGFVWKILLMFDCSSVCKTICFIWIITIGYLITQEEGYSKIINKLKIHWRNTWTFSGYDLKEIHFTSTHIFTWVMTLLFYKVFSVSAVGQAWVVTCEDGDLLKVKMIPKWSVNFVRCLPYYCILLLTIFNPVENILHDSVCCESECEAEVW